MTDTIVILREKSSFSLSHSLTLIADSYDSVRAHIVLPIHKYKVYEGDIKILGMICITNITGDNDTFRQNPDSISGIYITAAINDECLITTADRINQNDAKQHSAQVSAVK